MNITWWRDVDAVLGTHRTRELLCGQLARPAYERPWPIRQPGSNPIGETASGCDQTSTR